MMRSYQCQVFSTMDGYYVTHCIKMGQLSIDFICRKWSNFRENKETEAKFMKNCRPTFNFKKAIFDFKRGILCMIPASSFYLHDIY